MLPSLHTDVFVPIRNLHRPLFSLAKHRHLPQAALFTSTLHVLLSLNPETSVGIYPLKVQLPKKNSRADPRAFSHNWPGPRFKDPVLADLQAAAHQNHAIAAPVPSPPPNSSLSNCGERTKSQLLTPRGANGQATPPSQISTTPSWSSYSCRSRRRTRFLWAGPPRQCCWRSLFRSSYECPLALVWVGRDPRS